MSDDADRLVISYSELDAFRQCPFKHKLAYGDRYQGPTADNSALGKGSLFHDVMDVHYSTIKAHQQTNGQGHVDWDVDTQTLQDLCVNAVGERIAELLSEGHDSDILDLIMWMYTGYLEQHDLDGQWDIVEVESTHIVPLLNPDGSDSGIDMKCKLDLIVRDHRGRLWIVDHKTCGNLPTDKDLDWADQFGLYMMALRRKAGLNIHGTIHNAVRTKQNEGDRIAPGDPGYKKTMKPQSLEQRFKRVAMIRTDAELGVIEQDALADAVLAYSQANHRRRRPNEDTCKWRCSFQDACHFGRRTGKDSDTHKMLEAQGFMREAMRH